MNRLKNIGLCVCLSGMFLVGCGAPPVAEPVDEETPSSQTTEDNDYVKRIAITQDGVTKEVVCVMFGGQSISCDWQGYHLSDSKPTP